MPLVALGHSRSDTGIIDQIPPNKISVAAVEGIAESSLDYVATTRCQEYPSAPDNTCNSYQHDLSLSDEQRDELLDWVSLGSAEGIEGDEDISGDEDEPELLAYGHHGDMAGYAAVCLCDPARQLTLAICSNFRGSEDLGAEQSIDLLRQL